MEFKNIGLVLEGGGLRGVYTSGILQYFMEKELYFPYVIGVSMGACNAANYLSRQIERNKIVNISFVNDSRYLSYFRLITRGELFGMDFIFDTIPNTLVPFDYKTFNESKIKCVTTATNCITGEAEYYEKHELGSDYFKMLQASSSLPFISRPVEYKGKILMDGGMSDSIPIRKSIADGNKRNVVILTQPEGYRKEPENLARFVSLRYPHYKGLQKALANRHKNYNETIAYIEEMQSKGELFIIRPSARLEAGRAERSKEILYATYDRGYAEAKNIFSKLLEFLT
jgi:predicted patatin/cPLA2 family phospholipase